MYSNIYEAYNNNNVYDTEQYAPFYDNKRCKSQNKLGIINGNGPEGKPRVAGIDQSLDQDYNQNISQDLELEHQYQLHEQKQNQKLQQKQSEHCQNNTYSEYAWSKPNNSNNHPYYIKKFINSFTDDDIISFASTHDPDMYRHVSNCKYCRVKINIIMKKRFIKELEQERERERIKRNHYRYKNKNRNKNKDPNNFQVATTADNNNSNSNSNSNNEKQNQNNNNINQTQQNIFLIIIVIIVILLFIDVILRILPRNK